MQMDALKEMLSGVSRMGVDPADVLREMVAENPEMLGALQGLMQAGRTDTRAARLERREDIVKAHNEYRKFLLDGVRKYAYQAGFTGGPVKPTSDVIPENHASLLPTSLQAMQPNTTHRGRVLRGTLVAEATPSTGILSVLEDAHGAAVRVGLYNWPGYERAESVPQRLAIAASVFPRGRHVAIAEPFLKVAQDGNLFVRIDDPRDLAFLDSPGPVTWREWEEEGRRLRDASLPAEAAASFTRGLLADSRLLAAVLNNLAACDIQGGGFSRALGWAAAGAAVDGTSDRAWERVCKCLDKVGRGRASRDAHRLVLGEDDRRVALLDEGLATGPRREAVEAALAGADWEACGRALAENAARADPSHTPAALKERANAAFKAGKVAEARPLYLAALAALSDRLQLMEQRAGASLEAGRPLDALWDATCARWLLPGRPETLRVVAEAHLALGEASLALAACEAAEAVAQGDAAMQAAISELRLRAEAAGHGGGEGGGEQELHPEEEIEMMTGEEADAASVREVAAANAMMAGLPPEARRRGLDDRMPAFHEEFAREGRWPLGCGGPDASDLLWGAYERGRSRIMDTALLESQGEQFNALQQQSAAKRLGMLSEERVDWWLRVQRPGAVDFRLEELQRSPSYPNLWHSFGNSVAPRETHTFGTVHVAVGFADLASLADAGRVGDPDADGPVRWVGVDRSPASVAKTRVLVHMMQQGAPAEDVFQVWYSASWGREAERAFRAAVAAALAAVDETREGDAAVAAVLRAWTASSVPLERARTEWVRRATRSWFVIGNMKRKEDRMALCAYAVSGDALPAAPGAVGSVTMFTHLPGMHLAQHECFLHCVDEAVLWQRRKSEPDVVRAAAAHLVDRTRALAELLRSGAVTVETWAQAAAPGNGTVRRIRELRPRSMSWSNVVDYFTPSDFHAMARGCSAPSGTVHQLYSMNWTGDVWGACCLDFRNPRVRRKLHEEGSAIVDRALRDAGATPYVLRPPIEVGMNVCDTAAVAKVYRDWVDAFVGRAGPGHCQVLQVDSPRYQLFSHCNSLLGISLTYDRR